MLYDTKIHISIFLFSKVDIYSTAQDQKLNQT